MAWRRLAGLARWWSGGIAHPVATLQALPDSGGPGAGLAAVLTRFAVQDLVETLPLAILGRRPFKPGRLPARPEHYYRVQLAVLPAFGLGAWVIMSGTAQLALRLTGQRPDLYRVMDVIGVGMLIPMPPLWLADAVLISADRFGMPALGYVNVPAQAWETALFVAGLHTLAVPWRSAVPAGVAASAVYVLGASTFLR